MTDTSLDALVRVPGPRSPLRWLALPATGIVFVAGLWIAGGLLTDSFGLSMALVAAWYAVAAAGAYAIARRRSLLAVPVVAGYLLAAGGAGLYLAYSTFADRVVDETVVVGPQAAAGAFASAAHETVGRAAVVSAPDGGSVLTLTGFETDAGPDLRVRLVPGRNADGGAEGAIDLGALKGNRGDQQYRLPPGAPAGDATVVIYCRAFSVNFGSAYLAPR